MTCDTCDNLSLSHWWLCTETTVPKGHSVGWIITKFVLFPEYQVPSFPGPETQSPLLCSQKLLPFSIMAYSFAGDISQSDSIKHCTNFSLEESDPAKESSCYWPVLSQLCVLNNFFSRFYFSKYKTLRYSMHWNCKSPFAESAICPLKYEIKDHLPGQAWGFF